MELAVGLARLSGRLDHRHHWNANPRRVNVELRVYRFICVWTELVSEMDDI